MGWPLTGKWKASLFGAIGVLATFGMVVLVAAGHGHREGFEVTARFPEVLDNTCVERALSVAFGQQPAGTQLEKRWSVRSAAVATGPQRLLGATVSLSDDGRVLRVGSTWLPRAVGEQSEKTMEAELRALIRQLVECNGSGRLPEISCRVVDNGVWCPTLSQ
jgi:hypothetical protein